MSEKNIGIIGTLNIRYAPQNAATGTAVASQAADEELVKTFFYNTTYNTITQNASGPIPALANIQDLDRRWFTCLWKMLLYIVAKPTLGKVTDHLPPGFSGAQPLLYVFDCVPDITIKDQVQISIYPSALDGHGMTWDALAKTLLIYGTRIAEHEEGWESEQLVVTHEGVVTAKIGIAVVGGNG
ncbi:MAG: hypothetical protein Q9170_001705, partial [Blastenia crenularia]